jgi:hypothetical protein
MSFPKGPVSQVPMVISSRRRAVITAAATDSGCHGESRTRFREGVKPARPNIRRLSILIRLHGLRWRPSVPEQGETGDDRVAFSVDAGGERVEAGQVVLPDGVEPVRQALALAAGERGLEGPDVPGQSVEFGAARPDGPELDLLGLGEGFQVPEDPSGDGPGRGWPGGHRLR